MLADAICVITIKRAVCIWHLMGANGWLVFSSPFNMSFLLAWPLPLLALASASFTPLRRLFNWSNHRLFFSLIASWGILLIKQACKASPWLFPFILHFHGEGPTYLGSTLIGAFYLTLQRHGIKHVARKNGCFTFIYLHGHLCYTWHQYEASWNHN